MKFSESNHISMAATPNSEMLAQPQHQQQQPHQQQQQQLQQQAVNAFHCGSLSPNSSTNHTTMTSIEQPNLYFRNLYCPSLVNPFNIPRPNRRKPRKTRDKTTKPTPISPSEKPYVCPYDGTLINNH